MSSSNLPLHGTRCLQSNRAHRRFRLRPLPALPIGEQSIKSSLTGSSNVARPLPVAAQAPHRWLLDNDLQLSSDGRAFSVSTQISLTVLLIQIMVQYTFTLRDPAARSPHQACINHPPPAFVPKHHHAPSRGIKMAWSMVRARSMNTAQAMLPLSWAKRRTPPNSHFPEDVCRIKTRTTIFKLT